MYIRFQGRGRGGLFLLGNDLQSVIRTGRCRLNRADQRLFLESYKWLSDHTPEPPESAYAGALARPRTWFQPWASDHLRAAWTVARLLCRAGRHVTAHRSLRPPGVILYEDAIQLVVRPTPLTARTRPRPLPRPEPTRHRWNRARATIRRADSLQ